MPYIDTLSFRLHGLVYSMDKVASDFLRRKSNITLPQFQVIVCLYYHPNSNQSFIADWLQITEATTSHLAKQVITKGYVIAEQDPQDRRAKNLRATAAGMELVDELYPQLDALITPHYEVLTLAEREILLDSVKRVRTSIINREEKNE